MKKSLILLLIALLIVAIFPCVSSAGEMVQLPLNDVVVSMEFPDGFDVYYGDALQDDVLQADLKEREMEADEAVILIAINKEQNSFLFLTKNQNMDVDSFTGVPDELFEKFIDENFSSQEIHEIYDSPNYRFFKLYNSDYGTWTYGATESYEFITLSATSFDRENILNQTALDEVESIVDTILIQPGSIGTQAMEESLEQQEPSVTPALETAEPQEEASTGKVYDIAVENVVFSIEAPKEDVVLYGGGVNEKSIKPYGASAGMIDARTILFIAQEEKEYWMMLESEPTSLDNFSERTDSEVRKWLHEEDAGFKGELFKTDQLTFAKNVSSGLAFYYTIEEGNSWRFILSYPYDGAYSEQIEAQAWAESILNTIELTPQSEWPTDKPLIQFNRGSTSNTSSSTSETDINRIPHSGSGTNYVSSAAKEAMQKAVFLWVIAGILMFLVIWFYVKLPKKPLNMTESDDAYYNDLGIGGFLRVYIILTILGLAFSLIQAAATNPLQLILYIPSLILNIFIITFALQRKKAFLLLFTIGTCLSFIGFALIGFSAALLVMLGNGSDFDLDVAFGTAIVSFIIQGFICLYMFRSKRVNAIYGFRPVVVTPAEKVDSWVDRPAPTISENATQEKDGATETAAVQDPVYEPEENDSPAASELTGVQMDASAPSPQIALTVEQRAQLLTTLLKQTKDAEQAKQIVDKLTISQKDKDVLYQMFQNSIQ